jgi:hypothetical protein
MREVIAPVTVYTLKENIAELITFHGIYVTRADCLGPRPRTLGRWWRCPCTSRRARAPDHFHPDDSGYAAVAADFTAAILARHP